MSSSRDIYSRRSADLPSDLLQSLFLAELLFPSFRVWISSPWISDFDLIDNSSRQFGALVPGWPAAPIRFSDVLRELLERGSEMVIISSHDPKNNEFLSRVEGLRDLYPGRVHILRENLVHEKGILTDHFTLSGSMNLTYQGINFNQEHLAYSHQPEAVYERRLVLESHWGNRL